MKRNDRQCKGDPVSALKNIIKLPHQAYLGRWDVTLPEKQLLMLAISNIDSLSQTLSSALQQEWYGEQLDFGTVTVTVSEYIELTNGEADDAALSLMSTSKSLGTKNLTINGSIPIKFIESQDYLVDEELVKITFSQEFFKLLTDVTDDGNPLFASYSLETVKGLNLNEWKLFELIKSCPASKSKISIDNLKFCLASEIPPPRNFFNSVLDPALLKLRELYGMDLRFTGRGNVTIHKVKPTTTARKTYSAKAADSIESQQTVELREATVEHQIRLISSSNSKSNLDRSDRDLLLALLSLLKKEKSPSISILNDFIRIEITTTGANLLHEAGRTDIATNHLWLKDSLNRLSNIAWQPTSQSRSRSSLIMSFMETSGRRGQGPIKRISIGLDPALAKIILDILE